MISDFVRLRGVNHLAPREVEQLRIYLLDLLGRDGRLPSRGRGLDWSAIADRCNIDPSALDAARPALRPGLEALRRELRKPRPGTSGQNARLSKMPPPARYAPSSDGRQKAAQVRSDLKVTRQQPPAPKALADQPADDDPAHFAPALQIQMRRHRETVADLARAISSAGLNLDKSTLRMWRLGVKAPSHESSLEVLGFLEVRWGLRPGYFRTRLPHPARAMKREAISGIGEAERRRLAWHLPDDFDRLSPAKQEEILEWVRRVVVTGATDYRRYQAAALKTRFAVRFPRHQGVRRRTPADDQVDLSHVGTVLAPSALGSEMDNLLAFKTTTLTKIGYQRRGVWGSETASQKVEHFGLLFGALVASPTGPVRGYGAPISGLTFGLLVLPQVWDWYLGWRERRRGFFTAWEANMLSIAVALTSAETGWLTQTPDLADRLEPIPGLVSLQDIETVRSDWPAACAALHRFALSRSKEITRVARVHHDPFEPILPVLEADSPVGEYRKIADEILALRPCSRRYPKAAAESARAFLMIRFGLHLGFRQKNLRQLLVCLPGETPRSERQLSDRGCGELRWSERDGGWEVLVPSSAFKNAASSFFGGRPFRIVLPDIAGLYREIQDYVDTHRCLLLGRANDPGTFFVKSVKAASAHAAYDQHTFYEAWRWITQRYGIYNPYTGRGAIPGLLPHGPHCVRDVLATHILKQTGSFEQASYAIQDTPETVAQHYGRFLPQDKVAIATKVILPRFSGHPC
jgi:hypothetical protein